MDNGRDDDLERRRKLSRLLRAVDDGTMKTTRPGAWRDAIRRLGVVPVTDALVLAPTDDRLPTPVAWVKPLREELVRAIHDSRDWSRVSPRALEEIVAELLTGFGYEVELTKKTRDGGRDIIAIGRSRVKEDKYLIECKHWEEKVGISVVRELLGVGTLEPNSGLILVSTSGFTKDALVQAETEAVRWTLSLKDRDDLEDWIREYLRIRGCPT